MKKVTTLFAAIFAIAISVNANVSSKEAATFAESYYEMYKCGYLTEKQFLINMSKIAQPMPGVMAITLTPYAIGNTQSSIGSFVDLAGGPINIQTLLWKRFGVNENRDSITSSISVPLGNTSWTGNWTYSNLVTEMPNGKKIYDRSFVWYNGIAPYYVDTVFYTVPPAAVTQMTIYEKFFMGGDKVRFYINATNNDPTALYYLVDNATGQPLMAVADTLVAGTNFNTSIDVSGFSTGQDYTVHFVFTNTDGPGASNDFTFTMPVVLGISEKTLFSSLDGVVVLYNILGSEMARVEVSHGKGDLNYEGLVTGIYFYQFIDKKGKDIQTGTLYLK